ncbi:Tyrosine-protein phosphatase YwqE [Planctomycetes bacterium Pan216]|uniref:protein-tyrosine-phosphatase n=1 Tax=Kolteria novifilia TaxID=2527975 RepID=A0A518AWS9_9BACT|nr:Tyrosine-protein phosphatase YwqE [Planctomycetes bacterium Pan216]
MTPPANETLPAEGWIDIHSHLLPGIDDGCLNLSQSFDCVEKLLERGFSGTICTPHIWPAFFPENTPANVARRVERLRAELAQAGIDYAIWASGEVRIDGDTVRVLKEFGVPTLGPSKNVLVDFWDENWDNSAEEVFRFLLDGDYQPVLAHPERMLISDKQLDEVLELTERLGVWLQGNFNSISGGEGPRATELARRFLDEDRYYVLAMDMHKPDSLPGRFEGMTRLEDEYGQDRLQTLLHERPRELLAPAG